MVPPPIDVHFPSKKIVDPQILGDIRISLPQLNPPLDIDPLGLEDFAVEIHEWLSLIAMNSPRIDPEDKIDPFLSRYITPGGPNTVSKLVRITWRGFMTAIWVHKTFMKVLLAAPRDAWFAYSVVGFGEGWSGDSKDCTILKPPDAPNEYVMWEIAQ